MKMKRGPQSAAALRRVRQRRRLQGPPTLPDPQSDPGGGRGQGGCRALRGRRVGSPARGQGPTDPRGTLAATFIPGRICYASQA